MMWARHKTLIAVAAAVLLAGLVAGSFIALRHDGQARGAAAPSPSPSAAAQLRSPFTGEPVPSLNRVLAVKIDNIVYARPQTGLAHADIVYVLPVEGGLSRLMAIFSSRYPPVVGPVRSAREDDLQLLRQFGRPAFAYSGATPRLLPYIHRTARIVNLYAGTTSGYYRDLSRVAPYNLYAHTRQLLAQAPGASTARDIGFRFGAAARRREGHPVGAGVLPVGLVPLHLVGGEGALAGDDGRHPGGHLERRAAFCRHGGDPAHDGAHLPVQGVRIPSAVRGERRVRHHAGAARRPGVGRALVAAHRRTAAPPSPPRPASR